MLNKININPSKKIIIVYVTLTLVTLAVFWQVNGYDFINFDDDFYITHNNRIQSGMTIEAFQWAFNTKYYGLWNPLVWLSFMADYQLYGLKAGGYHLTNLLLHILSTLLLFRLFHRMTGAVWRSAFVAAFFALHPLHVESVAWIAERKDVLSAFFWMLTLCLYVYYTEKPVIRRYLLVLFSFVLALMSKPMVVTLPLILILLDYWPLKRFGQREIIPDAKDVTSFSTNQIKKKKKSKKETLQANISLFKSPQLPESKIAGQIPMWQLWEKAPFLFLSALLVGITFYTPNDNVSSLPVFKQFPLVSRLANAPVAFINYFIKTFWPQDMAFFYPFVEKIPLWQVMGASLLMIAVTIFVIVSAKRLPHLFVGWLWFAITIAPVLGIIQISQVTPYAMADRYHYLPSIGIAVLLVWGIPSLIKPPRSKLRGIPKFPLPRWEGSGEGEVPDCKLVTPTYPPPSRGRYLSGDPAASCGDLQVKNGENGKKILFPAAIIFLAVMGLLAWKQCSHWKNSVTLLNHALQVTKNNYVAHHNLGLALYDQGKFKEAVAHYSEAIRLKQDEAIFRYNRGNANVKLAQNESAIEDYDKAISLKPDYVDAYHNRGLAYARIGRYELAIADYDEVIRRKPNHFNAYYNKACACALQKNVTLACAWLREAINRGFKDWKHLQKDTDFDKIRNEACFVELCQEFKQ